jgi:tetratricopeptide (TPR) repeat protein
MLRDASLAIILMLAGTAGVRAACPTAEACFDEGVAAFVREDYKAAEEAFEAALKRRLDSAEFHLWLGRAQGRRAERMAGLRAVAGLSLARKVKSNFERAIELDPKHLAALRSLFDYYANAPGIVGGGHDKAEALIPRIAAVDPAQGLRAKASLHSHKGEWDAAEEAARKAVDLEPADIGHRLSLASLLARRGKVDESDRLFAQALAERPDDPAVWYSRADALVRAKREPAEARRLLERYLKTPLYAPDAEPHSDARKLLGRL